MSRLRRHRGSADRIRPSIRRNSRRRNSRSCHARRLHRSPRHADLGVSDLRISLFRHGGRIRMNWLTSDTHFNHANVIRYCGRPFGDVQEMNAALIARWNERVSRDDTVFHLGDFAMGSPDEWPEIASRLNGHKVLSKNTFFPGLGYRSASHLDAVLPEVKGADLPRTILHGNRNSRRQVFGFLDHVFQLLEVNDALIAARIWIKRLGRLLACKNLEHTRSGFLAFTGSTTMKASLPLEELGDVLTPTDVQRVLGIGRNATYELLASGKLPSIRVTPRRIVVTRRALEAFLGLLANTSSAGTP